MPKVERVGDASLAMTVNLCDILSGDILISFFYISETEFDYDHLDLLVLNNAQYLIKNDACIDLPVVDHVVRESLLLVLAIIFQLIYTFACTLYFDHDVALAKAHFKLSDRLGDN